MGRKHKDRSDSPVPGTKSSSSSSSSGGAASSAANHKPSSTKSTEIEETSIFDGRRKVREEEHKRSVERSKASDPTKYLSKFPRLMEIDYRSCKTYVLERDAVLRAWREAEVEMTDKQKVQCSHLASFDPDLLRGICKYDPTLRGRHPVTNEDLAKWLKTQLENVEKDDSSTDLKAFAKRLKEYKGKAELHYGRRAFITFVPILRAFDGAIEDFALTTLVEIRAKHVMEIWSRSLLDTISPSAACI
jgi:hypothetical protein